MDRSHHHDTRSDDGGSPPLSDDEVSQAGSSDSGRSEDSGRRRQRKRADTQSRAASVPMPTTCTMCDVAVSEYVCGQCGRLSFCLKCSVSLHDNKFLGSHKLTPVASMDSDFTVTVNELKAALHAKVAPPPQRAPDMPDANSPVAPDITFQQQRDDSPGPQAEPSLDLVALAGDRRLLRARVAEVRRCGDLLGTIATRAAHEKASSADSTRTAVDAVRRKFDVLRSLVNAKEEEFVEVIEDAGRQRLDSASTLCTNVTVSVTETEAYVNHMVTELDRLDGNHKRFHDCRKAMLDDVQTRTVAVDDLVAKFERELEEVQGTTMGVAVHLNHAIDAIQAIRAPPTLIRHYTSMTHHDPIPEEKFAATPGVKQWASDGTLLSAGEPGDAAASAPTPRKSLAQQVKELKSLPMPGRDGANSPARTQSPARATTQSPARPTTTTTTAASAPSNAPAPNTGGSALIARAAARSGGERAVFPPELQTLKRHIAQRAVKRQEAVQPPQVAPPQQGRTGSPVPSRDSSRAVSRTATPITRTSTPTRNGTPTRVSRAMSPTAATRARMNQAADTPANAPGPGQYFQSLRSFNSKSVLSTPPRRSTR